MVESTKKGAGRKFVSALMSVVLAVGLMPLPAYAAGDGSPDPADLTAGAMLAQDAESDAAAAKAAKRAAFKLANVKIGEASASEYANYIVPTSNDTIAITGLPAVTIKKDAVELTAADFDVKYYSAEDSSEATGDALAPGKYLLGITGKGDCEGLEIENADRTPFTPSFEVVKYQSSADGNIGNASSASPYANNYDNTWKPTVTTSGDSDKLVVSFDGESATESGKDFVYLYDKAGKRVQALSGDLANKAFVVDSNEAYARLVTNESVNMRGFAASVRKLDETDGAISEMSGAQKAALIAQDKVTVGSTAGSSYSAPIALALSDDSNPSVAIPTVTVSYGEGSLDAKYYDVTVTDAAGNAVTGGNITAAGTYTVHIAGKDLLYGYSSSFAPQLSVTGTAAQVSKSIEKLSEYKAALTGDSCDTGERSTAAGKAAYIAKAKAALAEAQAAYATLDAIGQAAVSEANKTLLNEMPAFLSAFKDIGASSTTLASVAEKTALPAVVGLGGSNNITPVVAAKSGSDTLTSDSDYAVAYYAGKSYDNPTASADINAAGEWGVLLTGKGQYYGTKSFDDALAVRANIVYGVLDNATKELTLTTSKPEEATGKTVYEDVEGTVKSGSDDVQKWHANRANIESFKIADAITVASVAKWFDGCSNLKKADLTNLTLSGTMAGMFNGCSSLEEVKVPAGFTPKNEWGVGGLWVVPGYDSSTYNKDDESTYFYKKDVGDITKTANAIVGTWKLYERDNANGGKAKYWYMGDAAMPTLVYPPAYTDEFDYDGAQHVAVEVTSTAPYAVSAENDTRHTYATDAGNYTFTLTPKSTFVWGDSFSGAAKTFNWKINKASIEVPSPGNFPASTLTELPFKDAHSPARYTNADVCKTADGVTHGESAGSVDFAAAGDYITTLKITNEAGKNWYWAGKGQSETDVDVFWTIPSQTGRTTVSGPDVPAELTYNGQDQLLAKAGAGYKIYEGTSADNEKLIAGEYKKTAVGEYKFYAVLDSPSTTKWSDGTIAPKTITCTIAQREITPPSATDYEYNGTERTGVAANDALYGIAGNKATDAGEYTATLTLKDTTNDKWADATGSSVTVKWKITPKTVTVPTGNVSYPANGSTPVVAYAGTSEYNVTNGSATAAGNYTAKLALKDKKNYVWSTGTTADQELNWSILGSQVTKVAVPTDPKLTYTGQAQTGVAANAAYTVVSGSASATNAGTYTATLKLSSATSVWADDNSTNDKTVTWTIAKAKVPVPVAAAGLVYDNTDKIGVPSNDLYTLTGAVTGRNAGEYTAKAALVDTANREWADGTFDGDVKWAIAKAKVAAPAVAPVHYTGKEVDSGLKATERYTVSGELKGTDIKEYTAKAKLADADNYEWADSTTTAPIAAERDVKWQVVKGLVEVPAAAKGLVYNGAAQTGVAVPAGALYTATGNTATNAGKHAAKLSLADAVHYTWADGTSADKELAWEIAQAPVAVTANAASKAYGDADPALTAKVTGLLGKDTIAYTLSRAKGEALGTYAISAAGAASQGNYAVTYKGAAFTIAKKSIDGAKVTLPAKTYRYTGKAITPEPTVKLGKTTLADKGDYTVSYKANKKAGTATVTVKGKGNYAGTAKATFKISKSAKAKYDPTITVAKKSKSVRLATVKKKAQALAIGAAADSGGKLTYKVTKADPRVTFKAGKATLKKGAPKGTYSINVQVSAKAKGKYAKGSETFTIKFTVK